VQVKYIFWVLGILSFGAWGVIAIIRPEVLYSTYRKHAQHVGWAPRLLERWLSSRLFQIEMRVWGAISLLMAGALLWLLLRERLGLRS
jgi:hypothetical protein